MHSAVGATVAVTATRATTQAATRATARSTVAARLLALLLLAVLVSGCGIRVPADPSGTLDHVSGGTLRAGVTPHDPWVVAAGTPGDEPQGREVEAIRAFAESLDADIDWTVDSEESLVNRLEDGELDLVAGGLTDQTPWTDQAGVSRPYAEVTDADGRTLKLVMLVPLGENAFLSRLETFMSDRADAGDL